VPTNFGATFSNQNHNEQILDIDSNEEEPEMPQHNDSNKETQNIFNSSDPIWKENVY